MIMKKLFVSILCLLAAACNAMRDMPETQLITIDTNVKARVFVDGEEYGTTPILLRVPRNLSLKIYLKPVVSLRCKAQKMDLHRRVRRELYATTNTSDSMSGTTINVTSTFYPLFADMSYLTQGRWIEYAPGSYYVDLKCEDYDFSPDEIVIQDYALRNYPMIAANQKEYVDALRAVSGVDAGRISVLAGRSGEPVAFMRSIKAEMDKKGKKE